MNENSRITAKDAQTVAAGAAYYVAMKFVFAFYPANIFALWAVQGSFDPTTEDGQIGFFLGWLVLFLVFCYVIFRLICHEKWPLLIFLYSITLYPFIKWFIWFMESEIPFPGVDWFPW